MLRAIVLVAILAGARVANTHPLDVGYLRIDHAGNRIGVQIDLDRNAAAILLGATSESLSPTAVANQAAALAERSFARAPITSAAAPCSWAEATATLQGQTVTISTLATCSGPGERQWKFPFVAEHAISSQFQLIVKESGAGAGRLTLIDAATTTLELLSEGNGGGDGTSQTDFWSFVWSGFEHTGVAPNQWKAEGGGAQLPDGIDHILFLLALMLGGGTLVQLLVIATGFTIGHSITLALAVLDIVRPPGSLIEPLIALSIALAATEAFTTRWRAHRWKIATGFGLVHGFGFAAALSHLDLTARTKVSALFGYNVGIELGQVAVVVVVAPLVLLAHRRGHTLAIRTTAAIIFACGIYWFLQRTLG